MDKRLTKYLAISFAISWVAWGILAVLIAQGKFAFADPEGTMLHVLGGFGPTIAAVLVLPGEITVKAVCRFIFRTKDKTLKYLLLFSAMEILTIALSAMELNPAISLQLVPMIFVQAIFVYGGNEELGWRGVLQPTLESKLPFPVATLLTGAVWAVWHIPLWFVEGASQQNISFWLFAVYAIFLSFWLAAVYKKTRSVFYCSMFHALSNVLLSLFVMKVNWILALGMVIMLACSIWLWYGEQKKASQG